MSSGLFGSFADNTSKESVASRMRRRRQAFFASLMAPLPKPVRLLDIGGQPQFWETVGMPPTADVEITLLNRDGAAGTKGGFRFVQGDARDLSHFRDGSFDVAFSNSVIEHVGGFEDQQAMAREAQRVGRSYFVQTPNKYFPIEPHFFFPLFQFLPIPLRAALLARFDLGWAKRTGDYQRARAQVAGVRLVSRRRLRMLFPHARIYRERYFFLTKSFAAYGGFVQAAAKAAPPELG